MFYFSIYHIFGGKNAFQLIQLFYSWCISFSELGTKTGWATMHYAENFENFKHFDDNVERINVKDTSCEEFIEKYEKIYKPVIIEGVQVSRFDCVLLKKKVFFVFC